MRIGFATVEYVTESSFDGGLSNYLHRVCLSLKAMGHEPIIFVTAKMDELLVHDGIEVHRVKKYLSKFINCVNKITFNKIDTSLNRLLQSWYINKKIKEVNLEKHIDLVQYTNLSGLGFFRIKSIPSVIRLSGHTRLSHLAGGYRKKTNSELRQEVRMEQLALKRVDAVFGPSKFVAEIIQKEIQRPVSVIETPYLMESLQFDMSIVEGALLNKKYLLFFGTIGLIKGVDIIGDIIFELFQKYPDMLFVFAGKDNGEINGLSMMGHLRKKAEKYNNRIVYLGKIRHEQLYPVINKAYAVVLPSRIDNLPNTCIEAMALKKIVIGAKGSSFEQLIIDGENGFLCESENPESLMKTIDKVMVLDPLKMKAIGEKAKERTNELRPEKVVKQLLEYYDSICKKNNK